MFAILSRGGARNVRLTTPYTTRQARRAEQPDAPIPADEAAQAILRGRGWENMVVQGVLDLAGQERLTWLPDGLRCASLNVSNCVNLEQLPERLDVNFLDVSGCVNLKNLPASLRVAGAIEVARSGLTGLRAGVRARLLWNGVSVDARTAFAPDTITGQEILNTANLELRRVKLERIGYERFIAEVGGLILDRDRDPGGDRKLVRIPFDDDEDVVVVCVTCPSTGRDYVLRVPPWTRTCREAAAWIAGFDDPDQYQPVIEA